MPLTAGFRRLFGHTRGEGDERCRFATTGTGMARDA